MKLTPQSAKDKKAASDTVFEVYISVVSIDNGKHAETGQSHKDVMDFSEKVFLSFFLYFCLFFYNLF